MKNNNKGFFLAETIVVVALVTTVMAFLYPNIANLYDNYNNRIKYYDQTEDLYTLKVLADWMQETPFIYDDSSDYQYTLLEYITMSGKKTGCLQYKNELKNLYKKDSHMKFDELNEKADNNLNLYSLQYCPTKDYITEDKENNGTCSPDRVFGQTNQTNQYDQNFSVFGNIKEVYITNYMSNLSSDNFNFNRYLKRMKKTTNDDTSYRLIGIFEENGETRFASIKVDNPSPNRDCN